MISREQLIEICRAGLVDSPNFDYKNHNISYRNNEYRLYHKDHCLNGSHPKVSLLSIDMSDGFIQFFCSRRFNHYAGIEKMKELSLI